jgi:hypothetical protein
LNAVRYNPTIKAFYQRLRAAGKLMKVARCAAARKLLHLAWALVKSQQEYRAPELQRAMEQLPWLGGRAEAPPPESRPPACQRRPGLPGSHQQCHRKE